MKPSAEIRVLHVDDDRSFLDVSKAILSDEGNFQIELAYSVEEALSKLYCGLFDVVISDYDMPTKNGLDFLKLVREKCPDTPFILFTGKGREEIAVQALNLGADRYINKQGNPKTVYTELSVSIFQLYEKSRAQKMLWESEERFEKMVTNSKELVMLTRNDGIILYVSPACKKILGYDPEELIGKSPWVTHPEDTERVRKIFESALINPVSETIEYRILTKQGETRWLSHSLSQIIENGEIKQIVSTIRDITETKTAEQKLLESEEKFSAAFNSSGAGLSVSRLVDGLFIDVNDCFLKLFGYTREEVIGKTSLQIHLYANPSERQEIVNLTLNNQPVINREVRALKKDFTEITILFSTKIVNIRDQPHLLTTFIGISELKQTTQALFLRQRELENIFETAPDAIILFDKSEKIVDCNEVALKICGCTKKEELVGSKFMSFVAEQDKEKILNDFRSALANKQVVNIISNGKRRDGQEFTLESSGKTIHDEFGNPTGFITICRDITEKIKKEKRMSELLSESEHRESNLKELLVVSESVLRTSNVKTVLLRILIAFRKILPSESGLIILTGAEEGKEISIFDHNGKSLHEKNIPEGLFETCKEFCSKGNPVFINDPKQYPYAQFIKRMHYSPNNGAIVPLAVKQKVVGYIVLGDKQNGFTDDDILIAKLLAEFAEIALENNSAMEALAKSEMQMRAITDAAKDAIVMIDNEAKISFWSSAAVQMFGYTFDEVCGKDFHKIFVPISYHKAFEKGFEAFRKTETGAVIGKTLELVVKRKGDQEFPVEISLAMTKIGNKLSVVGIIRDITERKIIDQKLRESEERYRFVAENAMDLITIHDLKGTFLYASPSIKTVMGTTPDALIGKKTIFDYLPPDEITKFVSQNKALLEKGEVPPFELHFATAKGPIWLEAKISIVKDESGEKRIIAISRDVTQRRMDHEERDKALAKAELLLEKLSVVGNFVRHDIRNKLTVISSLLYLTKKQAANNELLQKQLHEIVATSKNINRILEFAETYEVAGSKGLSWIQINNAINEAKGFFADLASIKISVTDMDFEVLADSALASIFHNLIENSLKYGKNLTQISISSKKQENGNLKIIYEDNGGGIDAEIKPRLFQKGAGKGTGLGLYLIKSICEIYGWSVQENGEQEKSARFEIEIPKECNRPLQSERYVKMQIAEYKEPMLPQTGLGNSS